MKLMVKRDENVRELIVRRDPGTFMRVPLSILYSYSPPTEGFVNSWGRDEVLKDPQKCKEFNLNFQRGGPFLQKYLLWGEMDILWNYTLYFELNCLILDKQRLEA